MLTPEQAIQHLEAWSDYHHAAAMSCPDAEVTKAHQNQRDNYQAVADTIRSMLPAPATDRPGDAAAIMHEETGIDYSECLVMCNMD